MKALMLQVWTICIGTCEISAVMSRVCARALVTSKWLHKQLLAKAPGLKVVDASFNMPAVSFF